MYCTATIHCKKGIISLFLSFHTSTSEMTLTDSVNPSHGTDACLHHQFVKYCIQSTQGVHFYHYRSVETSSPLKALFLCVGLVILKVSNVLTDSWVIKCQNMQTYKIVVTVIPVISLRVLYQFPDPDPREPCDIRFY